MIANLDEKGVFLMLLVWAWTGPGLGKERVRARRALPGAGKSGHFSKYRLRGTLSFSATVLDITEHLGFDRLTRVGIPCRMINAIAEFC